MKNSFSATKPQRTYRTHIEYSQFGRIHIWHMNYINDRTFFVQHVNVKPFESWNISKLKKLHEKPLQVQLRVQNGIGHTGYEVGN
jgi:hypothetical protein